MARVVDFVMAAALIQGGAAYAQSGVPLAREDVRAAAPTATAPPDGGRRYEYPPNTGSILPPGERSQYDLPADHPASKSSRAEPAPIGTNPANKPPEQVGR